MDGKFKEAKAYHSHSAVQATRTGMYKQATEAKITVRRIERSERVQTTAKMTTVQLEGVRSMTGPLIRIRVG
jgi:hypothetical protein